MPVTHDAIAFVPPEWEQQAKVASDPDVHGIYTLSSSELYIRGYMNITKITQFKGVALATLKKDPDLVPSTHKVAYNLLKL